jgi:hypothetical protein
LSSGKVQNEGVSFRLTNVRQHPHKASPLVVLELPVPCLAVHPAGLGDDAADAFPGDRARALVAWSGVFSFLLAVQRLTSRSRGIKFLLSSNRGLSVWVDQAEVNEMLVELLLMLNAPDQFLAIWRNGELVSEPIESVETEYKEAA